MNPVRRIAARVARGADRIAFPPAASAHEHWQRVVMNEAVEAGIAALGPESLRAAEISGDLHASKPWKDYVALAWPDFDIGAPLTEERRFDLVICEQVLEHVPDPCAAVENLRELCVPGGRVIVSTPFLIKVHEFPSYGMLDYWRFTPRGLSLLLEKAGLEVVEVGTWGNRIGVWSNLARWTAHRPWHPQGNNPETPVVVWAFARNPG